MTESHPSPLGSFEEQILLAVLRVRHTGEVAYGMAVRREIETVSGRDVAIGAVYATLDRLEAKGLVASERAAGKGGGSPRRVFAVTPAGARALDHCRELRDRLWHGIDLEPLLERGGG